MAQTHSFDTRLDWSGSTADGYRGYDRSHRVQAVAGRRGTPRGATTGTSAGETPGAPAAARTPAAASAPAPASTPAPAPAPLDLSADPAFRGDADRLNPEQLLVAAASSCQLLSFLALAARRGVDVRAYADEASGHLDLSLDRPAVAGIRLAPRIEVAAGTDHDLVRALVHEAHEGCYVANTLAVPVAIEPTIVEPFTPDPTWSDLAVELDDRPGALGRFAEVLGSAGVSLEGGGVFAGTDGRATAHFLVADGERARTALEAAGIGPVTVEHPVFTRLDQSRPGSLGELGTRLGAAGANIRVQYSDHDGRLVLLLDRADPGR